MLRLVRGFHRSHRLSGELKRAEREIKEGTEIEGFLVNKVEYIPEFVMNMIRLKHVRTGCDYLHLAREDSNNVFAVAFRTTPTDSTGLPHILEHTTLCGSTKYPCRDPFFKMLNRSIATFMNALTGADYTMYPFATQNKADYANLMSVYMDAVFKPQLREIDFRQEGWRFEHQSVGDKESPIILKGVVYNEMKGAFSENQTIFSEALLNNLLPSHTYSYISGGDPMVIPNLTYEDLTEFHKRYYHPSNCRMYSYGNFPLSETLNFVNRNYLGDYADYLQDYGKSTKVPPEPRWESERSKHVQSRPDPYSTPKKASSIAIGTLCNDIRSPQETFAMQVLSELLVRGPNSGFYKSMVEPLSSGFNPLTGYDAQTRDSIFTVGLDAVDPAEFDRITEIYHKTLDKVVNEGFEENSIKGILHAIELNTKHQTANFGLNMLFALTPIWNHDGDIVKMLKVNDKVMKIKKSIADNPLYLQDLTQEMLKENNHRLILTMSPDENYEGKSAAAEADLLRGKLSALGQHQKDAIYTQGLDLQKDQDTKQDASVLPSLTISDLARGIERVNLKGFTVEKVPVQFCAHPTNGLTYLRGVINTSILSEEAKSLLPLFCSILTKMGTTTHDYRQLDQQIKLKTGGITFAPHVAENIYDNSYEEGVLFQTFSLDRNFRAACSILSDIFNSVSFADEKRFETLVKTTASSIVHGLADSGHLYAMSTAASLISPSASRKEQFGGLTYVQTIKDLAKKNNLSETLETMARISEIILNKKIIRLSVNSVEQKSGISSVESLIKNLKGDFKKRLELSKGKMTGDSISIHHVMPYNVSYCGYCINTVEYSHVDYVGLRVLARLLTSKYLLPLVREKGGAYGAGANLSTSGVFSFYSYRDPNPYETFDIFNSAKLWARESGDFDDLDLDEAKLGVMQSVDAPVPPGSKGTRNFLYGLTDDEIERHRQAIIQLKREDLLRAADLLMSKMTSSPQGRALIGPENPRMIERQSENWQKRIVE